MEFVGKFVSGLIFCAGCMALGAEIGRRIAPRVARWYLRRHERQQREVIFDVGAQIPQRVEREASIRPRDCN